MSVIELDHVSKEFVHHRKAGRLKRERVRTLAVDDVSLSIDAGEVVGYIGPNGAGKSTTIKMLTGILVPSSGDVRVAGLDPQRKRIELTRRIGVVFGHRTQLWWDLPLRDSFDLLRYVYRVPADRHAENVRLFVELLGLGPLLDRPVRQLSLGERMRGELTAALLHDPTILYLDEPTIGLDIVSKTRVREFLATVNRERGVTILLTTHDLDDVERLCSRLVVIDRGHIVQDSTLADVRKRFAPHRTLVVDLQETAPPIDLPGIEVTRVDGPRQWLRFHRDEHTAAELIAQIAATTALVDISVVEPDIEEVIRHVYGDAA
jgi:ABC-2 type transport system ATP-binding protein